jgi:hypothetical protein
VFAYYVAIQWFSQKKVSKSIKKYQKVSSFKEIATHRRSLMMKQEKARV